jgi:MFS transporter, Spinster family, sphingosine-1-phosphate transporter
MIDVIASDTTTIKASQKRKNRYAYYVFFVLFAATFLNGLDGSQFTGAANVIARELHLGINDVGVLTSAFTIFLTVSIIPVGIWADRARRLYVIAACLAVWSLATALTALAGGFLALFATRMFTGIGEAGYMPAGYSLVGDSFGDDQCTRVISLLSNSGPGWSNSRYGAGWSDRRACTRLLALGLPRYRYPWPASGLSRLATP